jgi:AcrR family transcriptional regulator
MPPGSSKSKVSADRSAKTRARILEAASAILSASGHARLTMRRVAADAGLTVGNLTYHYPSKRGLIQALILSLIAEYKAKFAEYLLLNAPTNSRDGLAELIVWLVEDSVSRQTSRLFREFWNLAIHDNKIGESLDQFYDEVFSSAAASIAQRNAAINLVELRELMQLTAFISEGSNVLYATVQKPSVSLNRVIRLAQNLIVGQLIRIQEGIQKPASNPGRPRKVTGEG